MCMPGMVACMIVKPLIFISSTSDRQADRSALANALLPTFEPYLFEQDRARGVSPRQRCAEMINACDSFIAILGTEYGSVYEEDSGQDEGSSITEWEFDTASQRSDLEMMMFVASDTRNAQVESRQQRFLERVQGFKRGVWCKFFSSPTELVDLVKSSLVQWLAEYLVQAKTRGGVIVRKRIRLAFVVSAMVMLLALGAVVGHFQFGLFYKSAVLTICGVAVGAIAALTLLVLKDD